jgi:prohibitin 2
MTPLSTARLIGAGVILLAVIVAGSSATYIVPPGHRGVLVTLGKVSPQFKGEGFGMKTPFISEVIPIPIKQLAAGMEAAVISKDLQEVRTKTKVLYRVPEKSVVQIYQQFKGDPFLSLIQPRVDEALKEIAKEHTAEEIVQGRAAIKKRALQSARKKIGELLTVVDVVVEDISLSSNLEAAIERKMVQEQEANKAVSSRRRRRSTRKSRSCERRVRRNRFGFVGRRWQIILN